MNYRQIIPPYAQTCGNCRFWDEENRLEIPLSGKGFIGVLAPCKRFAPEEASKRLAGNRVLMDVDESCPAAYSCWLPSRQFLRDNPEYRARMAAAAQMPEREAA